MIPCVTVSYFTFPAVSTLAVVNLPSWKFNPSNNLTSCAVVASELDLYFNLMFAPIVLVSTPIVTLSPTAFVVIPFSPTILNFIPQALFNCCLSVVVALSPTAFLNSADVNPVNSFPSFIFIFPVLSTIEPILLSDNLVLSAPPTTSNLSFSFLDIVLFAFAGS